jgi:peptidyl-prolyl isomerase D
MSPIVIAACGVLSPDDPSLTTKPTPADGDPYENFPDDDGNNVQDPKVALSIAKETRPGDLAMNTITPNTYYSTGI